MNPSVNISRYQRLDGTVLKLIACLSMFIDHLGAVCFSGMMGFRIIGRLAFPIYCFLLVEGAVHTRNMKKYILRMGIFALISEIPFDLAFYHRLVYTGHQNVFFTLFLGYLAFCAFEYFWDNQKMQFVCILALLAVSVFLKADYGWRGFVFLLIMYWFRNEKTAQAIIGSCWLYYEWKACFAFLSINMYNGERGFVKGKFLKYVFYWFYPVHIIILVILRQLLFFR